MQINNVKTAQTYTFTSTMTESELLDLWEEYKKITEAASSTFYAADILVMLKFVSDVAAGTINSPKPE